MSVNEILAELDALSPEELKIIREKIDVLNENIEITPEMHAAIDEGLRSLKEEGSITIEALREEMKTWNFKSS